jgi:hypothetical protein
MKIAMLCSAIALSMFSAAAWGAGPVQRYTGGYYGGGYTGHVHGGGMFGGHGHGRHAHGWSPRWEVSRNANHLAPYYGHYHNGAFGVPAVAPPAYVPGPPTAAVTYPYYTVRGPRDFLMDDPPGLGP